MMIELIYDNHRKQGSRYDHLDLWGVMRDLGQDIGQRDVITLLQDLGEMDAIKFKQEKNDFTNDVRIVEIELKRKGILLAEKKERDPLVQVLL